MNHTYTRVLSCNERRVLRSQVRLCRLGRVRFGGIANFVMSCISVTGAEICCHDLKGALAYVAMGHFHEVLGRVEVKGNGLPLKGLGPPQAAPEAFESLGLVMAPPGP